MNLYCPSIRILKSLSFWTAPVLLIVILLSVPATAKNSPSVLDDLYSQEIWIAYSWQDQYIHIKEYNLSTKVPSGDATKAKGLSAAELVKNGSYCNQKYWLQYLVSVDERLYHDRGSVTAECHFISSRVHPRLALEDILGAILKRPVTVEFRDTDTGIYFDGTGLKISAETSEGVFAKDEQRAIFYKPQTSRIEIVVGPEIWPSDYISIVDFVPENTAGPVSSLEEINAIKKMSKPRLVKDQ